MTDTTWVLIFLAGLAAAVGVLIWAARQIAKGKAAQRFVEETEELHGGAYTAESEEDRRAARARFEELVVEAANSKNPYMNNRDIAEMLKGFVDTAALMAEAARQTDAAEAASWRDRVTEKLQPMYYRGRIEGRGKARSGQ